MAGLNLLDRAAAAGLSLTTDDEFLIVEGPRSAAVLVAELYSAKAEVMAALRDRDALNPNRGDAYEGDLPPGPTLLTGGCGEEASPFDWASAEPLPWRTSPHGVGARRPATPNLASMSRPKTGVGRWPTGQWIAGRPGGVGWTPCSRPAPGWRKSGRRSGGPTRGWPTSRLTAPRQTAWGRAVP